MLRIALIHDLMDETPIVEMKECPRIGDQVIVFFVPSPHVKNVLWVTALSQELSSDLDMSKVDAVIYLE